MARRKVTDEQLATAERVIAGGGSNRAAARESGLSPDTIKRRWGTQSSRQGPRAAKGANGSSSAPGGRPRGVDPPPGASVSPGTTGGHDRRRGRSSNDGAPTDEQLESMCRKIAKLPAPIMLLVFRCHYCNQHFLDTAAPLAAEVVDQARDDADLHEILVWGYKNWRKYAWAGMLATWAGVPVVHHLAPDLVYNAIAPLAGMPARHDTAKAPHAHRPAGGAHFPAGGVFVPPADSNGNFPTGPAGPAGGMFDGGAAGMEAAAAAMAQMPLEDISAMARSMGIELDESELAAFLGREPGVEPEPGEPAPDDELVDDFIEPEPTDLDLALDMLEDNGDDDEPVPPGADSAGASAAGAPADPGVPDTLL